MVKFKAIVRFCAEVILVLGALACILVWLEIKPKDLRVMRPENTAWLLGALALFCISIGSSIYTLIRRLRHERQIAELEQENLALTAKLNTVREETAAEHDRARKADISRLTNDLSLDLEKERNRKRPLVERAGAVRSKAGQADWLKGRLEEIWHLYDADKHANEALLYPLSTSVIPEEIKEWRHKQLWGFRVLYQSHISAVKSIDRNFHSNLIDEGFPRDGETYLSVMRKIEAHAALLRDRADQLVRADASGEAL